jgi:hypothetical protein
LALDMASFNVAFFLFVRAMLFASAGIHSWWPALLWGVAFSALVVVLGRLSVAGRRQSALQIVALLAVCFLLVATLAVLVRHLPREDSPSDFSWLIPETIKTPLWAGMMARLSPLFVAICLLAVLGLMRWTAGGGRRWLLAVAAGGACLAATAILGWSFWAVGNRYKMFYWVAFVSPLLLVCIAGLAGWFRLAFRAVPLALHVSLISLNYIGALPVHSFGDLVPGSDPAARVLRRIPGARFAYRPTAEEARLDFRFPRELSLLRDRLVMTAGPMGATTVYTIDPRDGRRLRTESFPGLIRATAVHSDLDAIFTANWDYPDLNVLDPRTLATRCSLSLHPDNMVTPWNLRIADDRLYMTNVTLPLFAEYAIPAGRGGCGAKLARIIDFHRAGFTPFTDGAYGVDVDPARGTALITVGMLEGRYLLALVEIGLDDFRIRRELRFPSGVVIAPIAETRRVLLPSYYYREIFEVDLDAWKVVRAIRSAANIFHLAYDPARRLIYAVSRAAGVLQAIDYDTGRLVREDPIGNKADPLLLDGDRLLIASHLGIVEIDLTKYVGPPRPR